MNAFGIVKDFEKAVAEYTGAPYCVAVNSCTSALFLCLAYHNENWNFSHKEEIEIPKRTYVSVPMQIKHVGLKVKFRDEDWKGIYQLRPLNVWDAARRFTYGMYVKGSFMCTSHHWSKILGIQQGGCILHDNKDFDTWARKARFDGRTEGVAPTQDSFDSLGWHMYMSPEVAAEGLVRLMHLPKNNPDLPNDNYPDLSKLKLFK